MPGAWWQQLLLVMAGGALGSAGRFWVSSWMLRQFGTGFPWGTLTANLIGAFAIGYFAVWLEGRGPSALYLRAFVVVGVLGGLTTFSALMLESLLMSRTHRQDLMLAYLAVSLAAGLALVWAGARLAMSMRG